MMPQSLPSLLGHSATRYVVVGGLCFVIDYLTLRTLVEVAHWPLQIATVCGLAIGLVVSYTLQRIVAFQSQALVGRSFVRYCLLVAFNTVAVTCVVTLFEHVGLGYRGGKVFATGLTTLWNYFLYAHWVYAAAHGRRRGTGPPAPPADDLVRQVTVAIPDDYDKVTR